jgi:polyphosphate:AMP phosphotransferase
MPETPPEPADTAGREDVAALRLGLLEAQAELRERGIAAAILIGGEDRWGCSEVLDRLNEWLDPGRMDTVVQPPPTAEEAERPFLWRAWRDLPARGRIALFHGGWPDRLVLEAMRGRSDAAEFDRRLEAVRSMDRMLAADGLVIARLWIHVPLAEHRRRFEAARTDPQWRWRLDATDRAILERYEQVVPLARRLVEATDAPHAPWRTVQTTDPQARDLEVGRFILERLRAALDGPTAVVAAGGDVGDAGDAGDAGAPPPAGDGRLAEVDHTAHLPKEAYESRLPTLQARLARRMRQLADGGQSAVVVLEGPDAAGKGGVIRRIVPALPATMERVVRIGPPTDAERARQYLWRFWRELPRAGHLLIFDRSWYGRVLVERVEGLARPEQWRRAYAEINDFEQQLHEAGIVLLKFWLDIDRDEQRRRFEARQATGWKRYKITEADWRARERWDDYRLAAEEMFARTDRRTARWTVVPADDKRFARIQVLETLVKALKRGVWRGRRGG